MFINGKEPSKIIESLQININLLKPNGFFPYNHF